MEKLLLRPAEAAEVLGMSRSRVYELMRARVLPTVRVGLSRRIPVSALKAWIARETARAASSEAGADELADE